MTQQRQGRHSADGCPRPGGGDVVEEVLGACAALTSLAGRSLGVLGGQLSAAQYRMLVALESSEPLRVVDLAHVLEVDSSSIGRMCDRLERKGLLVRRRAPGDRRTVLVSLSEAGRQMVEDATSSRHAAIDAVFAQLGERQRQAAISALRAAVRACEQMSPRERR